MVEKNEITGCAAVENGMIYSEGVSAGGNKAQV